MYLEGIETNRTRLWILNSLLELVGQKDYNSITIDMIVDRAQLGSNKMKPFKYIALLFFIVTLFSCTGEYDEDISNIIRHKNSENCTTKL